MATTDALQQAALLFGWFLALGFDVGGALRHAWRLRYRQAVYARQRRRDLQYEARLRRNSEWFRVQLKLGMTTWAVAVLMQRLTLDWAAPVGWWPWLLWATHVAMLVTLYTWTAREPR